MALLQKSLLLRRDDGGRKTFFFFFAFSFFAFSFRILKAFKDSSLFFFLSLSLARETKTYYVFRRRWFLREERE